MNSAMLRFLYRKMLKTRWLTISTLFGLIVAVSFTTSIPMYSDGSLKRVVAKTLQEQSSGMPAGSLLIRYQTVGSEQPQVKDYDKVNQYIKQKIPKLISFPNQIFVHTESIRSTELIPVDSNKVDASRIRTMTLSANSELQKHIQITRGRMYSDQIKNGVIEVIVMQEALYRNDIQIGDEFKYPISGGLSIKPLVVKIVGAYKPKSLTNPYWYQGTEGLINSMVISDTLFHQEILQKKHIPLNLSHWYFAFDLSDIKTSQLSPLEHTLERLNISLYQQLKGTRIDISFASLLKQFRQQSIQLQILLFSLAAPMIAMVFFYIVMNARQSLERQQNDIAVIRSRGASTRQIIWIYLLEGFILGGLALLIGPLIGWFMAKSIGSSSGFLSFVDRKSLPIDVSSDTVIYGLVAVIIAISASVVPAILYARSSIVDMKKHQARGDGKPFWQRWYLDIGLLALSGYGYYLFDQRQIISMTTGVTTDQLQVQPLLFFVPALSIFSLGLFFLRLFPWILRFFKWLSKRVLPVHLFLTLTQLSRSAKSYYPLMLLLILTIGLGVYNSSAARTIDQNSTERILYKHGSDAVVQAVWEGFSDTIPTEQQGNNNGGNNGNGNGNGNGGGNNSGNNGNGNGNGNNGGTGNPQEGMNLPVNVRYVAPPFQPFQTAPGVEYAAKVLRTKANVVISGRSFGEGQVMAINNADFWKVAWFRKDLYPAAPWKYLNLLGAYEQAVIVPTSFAKEHDLKKGDLITLAINQHSVDFVMVGELPYWPTEYPQQTPFFITNLSYIYDQIPKMPYEVWLKMLPGAKMQPVIDYLQKKQISVASVDDVRNALIKEKRMPARGGVFGILSLGFLISVFITLIGYILYWVFNLSSRTVQFGILRATGLKRKHLSMMLLLEQIFTAGLSVVLGLGIGRIVSYLYLPFLQTSQNLSTQVPPFRVVFALKDSIELFIVVLIMLLTGVTLLFMQIRRLRVHQAIKMGEER